MFYMRDTQTPAFWCFSHLLVATVLILFRRMQSVYLQHLKFIQH